MTSVSRKNQAEQREMLAFVFYLFCALRPQPPVGGCCCCAIARCNPIMKDENKHIVEPSPPRWLTESWNHTWRAALRQPLCRRSRARFFVFVLFALLSCSSCVLCYVVYSCSVFFCFFFLPFSGGPTSRTCRACQDQAPCTSPAGAAERTGWVRADRDERPYGPPNEVVRHTAP